MTCHDTVADCAQCGPFARASGFCAAMAEASGRIVLFAVENHPVRQAIFWLGLVNC